MQAEASSSLFRSILEQMADAVIYADAAATIQLWNGAAAALFGYSAAEALARGAVAVTRDVTERIEQQRAARAEDPKD
jgi:PAS domain-containing protein